MRLSPANSVAGVVEIHEMAMDNGVMKMRQIPWKTLPDKTPRPPGSYHVMPLMTWAAG